MTQVMNSDGNQGVFSVLGNLSISHAMHVDYIQANTEIFVPRGGPIEWF
mgnify:CR=1 FL=1